MQIFEQNSQNFTVNTTERLSLAQLCLWRSKIPVSPQNFHRDAEIPSRITHLLGHVAHLLRREIIEGKDESPVEIPFSSHGSVVDIRLLLVLLVSHQPPARDKQNLWKTGITARIWDLAQCYNIHEWEMECS